MCRRTCLYGGMCIRRQVPRGVASEPLKLELQPVVSHLARVLRIESKSSEKATSWTVSPANNSFLLVTLFYLPYKEMSFTLASAFILLLPLTKFLLTPLTCPAPAEPPSTNCLLLSCYMYSIILFWFFSPSAHLLRSLYISTLTHIHTCMTWNPGATWEKTCKYEYSA